jgi:hypothetical protein
LESSPIPLAKHRFMICCGAAAAERSSCEEDGLLPEEGHSSDHVDKACRGRTRRTRVAKGEEDNLRGMDSRDWCGRGDGGRTWPESPHSPGLPTTKGKGGGDRRGMSGRG